MAARATPPIPPSPLCSCFPPFVLPAWSPRCHSSRGLAEHRVRWPSPCLSFTLRISSPSDSFFFLPILTEVRSSWSCPMEEANRQRRGGMGTQNKKKPPMNPVLVGNQAKKFKKSAHCHCKQIPSSTRRFQDQPSHPSTSPTPSRTGWPRQRNIQQTVLLPLLRGRHLLKNSQMNLEWSTGHFVMLMTVTNCLFFIVKCWLIVSWGETRQLACALQSFCTHPNYSCEDTLIWRDTVCGHY